MESNKENFDDFGLPEEQSKLESEASNQTADERLKKQSSYTYWVQNNREQFPQHKDQTIIAPKKLDDPELVKQLNSQTANTTGSAWNKAGTWEDKKLKMDVVKRYFQSYLVEAEATFQNGELQATNIEELSGEGSIIMSRGKRRIGYELELKIQFAGQDKYEGLECSVRLRELCDDGSEPEGKLYVTSEKSGSKDQGVKFKKDFAAQKTQQAIVEKCREILNIIRDEL